MNGWRLERRGQQIEPHLNAVAHQSWSSGWSCSHSWSVYTWEHHSLTPLQMTSASFSMLRQGEGHPWQLAGLSNGHSTYYP